MKGFNLYKQFQVFSIISIIILFVVVANVKKSLSELRDVKSSTEQLMDSLEVFDRLVQSQDTINLTLKKLDIHNPEYYLVLDRALDKGLRYKVEKQTYLQTIADLEKKLNSRLVRVKDNKHYYLITYYKNNELQDTMLYKINDFPLTLNTRVRDEN